MTTTRQVPDRRPAMGPHRGAAAAACGTLRRERGLSSLEVTIMVAVLFIVGGTLVPVLTDSVSNARHVRARNDLSQLALSLINFQRDVGPAVFDGSRLGPGGQTTPPRAVQVLLTGGVMPGVSPRVPRPVASTRLLPPSGALDASALVAWTTRPGSDLVDDHLRVNGRRYRPGSGGRGTGWSGPYLTHETQGDPWGHAYLINAAFLPGLPPHATQCDRCAVFVLSAGPNGLVETPFRQLATQAAVLGDDIAVRVQ